MGAGAGELSIVIGAGAAGSGLVDEEAADSCDPDWQPVTITIAEARRAGKIKYGFMSCFGWLMRCEVSHIRAGLGYTIFVIPVKFFVEHDCGSLAH